MLEGDRRSAPVSPLGVQLHIGPHMSHISSFQMWGKIECKQDMLTGRMELLYPMELGVCIYLRVASSCLQSTACRLMISKPVEESRWTKHKQ